MTNFAKPATASYVQALAASKGSWISAFAKPGALWVASDLAPRRMSWATALAKTAAVPAAAASPGFRGRRRVRGRCGEGELDCRASSSPFG